MPTSKSVIVLPPVPDDQAHLEVAVWSEPVGIDTYPVGEPSVHPAFLDRRVYQGSSGRVYPLPFYDSVGATKTERRWEAVHLQNEWLRLMILPELGGRIHLAVDRKTGRDLFYRNNVIKPALVGLTGPWISGGVEFNWPQHHRPGTYLPVETSIERHPDGSVTVWCSDHDPFERMKGMHGIRLHPDRAVMEVAVRLYNRTPEPQTFLWWANVAVRVDEDYQSFFPPDVTAVADHAKRAVSSYPRADGRYYGIDYPARVDPDHPDGDRLDWWRNIPVPTSYMCVGSRGDFFGGYDHAHELGFVHWADHHVSPGKKQWTWGNSDFGRVWEHNLTDGDGPYIELMAGVYTENQPDFAFLAPGETKSFSQFWYPIHGTGPATGATVEAAGRLHVVDDGSGPAVAVTVAVTRRRPACHIRIRQSGRTLAEQVLAIEPGTPGRLSYRLADGESLTTLEVTVHQGNQLLLELSGGTDPGDNRLIPAEEPPAPADIPSTDELFLTGLHLDQYRHATRSPEPYWRQVLAIDSRDSRTNTALGHRLYRAGRFVEAAELLMRATSRVTALNPNPVDGAPHYFLGLVRLAQGEPAAAYDNLSTAAWVAGWRAPAHYLLAQIDSRSRRWDSALDHLDRALAAESAFLQAADLRALVLRALNRGPEADRQVARTLRVDPLDNWALHLAGLDTTRDPQSLLDLALDYVGAGFAESALSVLDQAVSLPSGVSGAGNVQPLLHYHRAATLRLLDREQEAAAAVQLAGRVDQQWCFPGRLADFCVLRSVLDADPANGSAAGLLGHWLYAHERHTDAAEQWSRAVERAPGEVVVLRNLALASVTVDDDAARAAAYYARATVLAPGDGQLWFERDQLAARNGAPVAERLWVLESHPDIVGARDDLSTVMAELMVIAGRPSEAIAVLASRLFQPWEGGEGRVCRVWAAANLEVARSSLAAGDAAAATAHLEAALHPPINLAETWHPLDDVSPLELMLGDAAAAAGDQESARAAWTRAAAFLPSSQVMEGASTLVYYSCAALQRLGLHVRTAGVLDGLHHAAAHPARRDAPDYFATSLPQLLLFPPKPGQSARRDALLLAAQLCALTDRPTQALEALDAITGTDPADLEAHGLRRAVTSAGSWNQARATSPSTEIET